MVTSVKQLISLVVPVYNEESNITWFYEQLSDTLVKLTDYNFEVIFVDDGSSDKSAEIIKDLSKQHKTVRYVQFSRNFGKEAATTAGLAAAHGDAVIMLDADGQHPTDLIAAFINKWEQHFEVVVGVRKANTKEGFIKRYGSKLFYAMLSSFTGSAVVVGSTDYRLLDRKVVDEFNKLTERSRMTRGLIDWLGFKRDYINFVAPARHSGTATYDFSKLFKLAIHGFVSQSTKPLQFTGILGFIVTFLSTIVGVLLFIERYLLGDPLNLHITGKAFLAIFLSLLVGLVLICQWLLALYIENIHHETQNRPLYIVTDESK